MLILSILPLVALYVYARLIWPMSHVALRVTGALILFGTSCLPIYLHLHGGISHMMLDRSAMLVGNYFIILAVNLVLFTLFRDVVWVLLWIIQKPLACALLQRKVAFTIVAVGILVSGWGMRNALLDPIVVEEEIHCERLPATLDGTTIVQLSDLHVANIFGRDRLERIVAQVNALKPDLIAVTGDTVDGRPQDRQSDLYALLQLKAKHGVFYCEGNHDYYVTQAGWRATYAAIGLDTLYNEHRVVRLQGGDIVIVGLTDPIADRFRGELPNMMKAMRNAPKCFTIVLEHEPVIVRKIVRYPAVDLVLCGHTHGGQTPLFGLIVKAFNGGFVYGQYRVGERGIPVYVHPGTGFWTGFCTRILSRNSIVRITLRAVRH